MPRDPSQQFLELAERLVTVTTTPESTGPVVVLTPIHQLNGDFPARVPGTLYDLFASTSNDDCRATVVVTDPATLAAVTEQAHREAALGMTDNMYFR